MKYLLFACVCAIIPAQAFTQENAPQPKHVLGINFFSTTTAQEMLPWIYYPTGVYYTVDNGKRTWRFSVNGGMGRSSPDFVNRVPGVDNGLDGKTWALEAFCGVQRLFKKWKNLEMYWFADAGYHASGFTGKETYGDNTIVYYDKPYVTRRHKIGVAPGFGLRYTLFNHLSICTEADAFIYTGHHRYVESERHHPYGNWNNDWMLQLHKLAVAWTF